MYSTTTDQEGTVYFFREGVQVKDEGKSKRHRVRSGAEKGFHNNPNSKYTKRIGGWGSTSPKGRTDQYFNKRQSS